MLNYDVDIPISSWERTLDRLRILNWINYIKCHISILEVKLFIVDFIFNSKSKEIKKDILISGKDNICLVQNCKVKMHMNHLNMYSLLNIRNIQDMWVT